MTPTMRKGALTLAAVSSVLGAGLLAPSAQAAPAGEDAVDTVAGYGDCDAGLICFWDGKDGTGHRCEWSGNDSDWWNGAIVCSWADEKPPLSVYNHGQSESFTGVVYFKPDGSRAGCTRRGQHGNLSGDYKVRSHLWTTGNCG